MCTVSILEGPSGTSWDSECSPWSDGAYAKLPPLWCWMKTPEVVLGRLLSGRGQVVTGCGWQQDFPAVLSIQI